MTSGAVEKHASQSLPEVEAVLPASSGPAGATESHAPTRAASFSASEIGRGSVGLKTDPDQREPPDGLLSRQIARIDILLSEQVNAILHHPRFQQLEASWRGLKFLVDSAEEARELAEQDGGEAGIKIRVLAVSKRELFKDLDGAGEFDQSQIWRKVYEEEFGMPGGEPYGALLGDYEFTNHVEDIELLTGMGEVAAAAFAPFLASASPALLGLDSLAELEKPINLEPAFQQLEYLRWRSLREREDSRFLGLLLPRTLMRLPYENDGGQRLGFRFSEDTSGRDHRHYLWGSSAYAFGSVLVRAFATSGWFADIRGAERGVDGGGLVTGLPAHSFGTDARGIAIKASTEVALPEEREPALSSSGFITLCHCQDTANAAYFGNQSVHRPKQYSTVEATTNAKISAMLQYVLCASRFAHYLKVYVRDKLGGYRNETEVETELGRWLSDYVAEDDLASPDVKARWPLREGRVQIREIPGKPGSYRMVMHLLPHFQLDQLTVALKMVTRLTPTAAS